MRYFKNANKEIFAYSEEDVINGYGKDLVSITEEEMKNILAPTPEEIENRRISQIKAKASELITTKYSIIWQLNHPRTDVAYASDYAYIDNIRNISNEAEANGTALEDIDWGV